MDGFDLARLLTSIIIVCVLLIFSIIKLANIRIHITTKFIARTAIFSAISILLYTVPYLKFPLPFFPSFLEIHFDEIPAFIAGFAYGPFSAVVVLFIKTIVKLPFSTSLCVGELADLLYSLVFIIPACVIYQKKRSIKNASIGFGVGTLSQVIFASFFTTFVILNFYMFVMGLSEETILKMCQAINPNITSLTWPFLFMVALPFNLFKDALVVVITFLLYKKLHRLIDKIGQEKN